MASEVKLPALGENVEGGDVVDVKVNVGDEVKQGQALVEVEAEKSTVEVPSPVAGRVTKVLIKKGDTIATGQALFLIDGDGKPASGGGQAPPRAVENAKAPLQGAKPQAPGAPSPLPEEKPTKPPAEAKPQSVVAHPPSPAPQAPAPTPAPPKPKHPAAPQFRTDEDIVPAGPATRKLAREWGIDLRQVQGSGVDGRVTQEDVHDFVRDLASGASGTGGSAARARLAAPPLPNFEQWGPVDYQPFDSIRKKTAEHVTLAWTTIPHVTQHDLADATDIEAFRKQQEGKGPKLTVTAFVVKACAIVLKQFPQFNASLDTSANRLVLKQYYHLGIAVDTDRGLLVPVLRDVDKKSVQEIAQEMTDIAERARQKKLSADDMRGGTFTISNLGGIGGTGFTPIVNHPEVAILGLSRSRLQPVSRDGQFVPRLLLPLSLSYDHRVIDGADAARFTRRVAEMLENPLVMLLHA